MSPALEELVRQIVDAAHPLRIILFGSAARGETRPGSDLDLLVVMPDGTPPLRAARKLYGTIQPVGQPVDLLVATPSILARHGDNPGLIYRAILAEGKTVYAA